MRCFVYILRSLTDGSLYVGQTNDPERRLSQHNSPGRNAYASARGPWELVHSEMHDDRGAAMARERFLKSCAGSQEKKRLAGTAPATREAQLG